MNGYICLYKGKKIEVEAETSYKAQQIATEKFQKMFPKNKVKGSDISTNLAEKDGKQVTTHCESIEELNEIIKKEKGKYNVYSHKGKHMGGPYDSKSEAVTRLREIEYFKAHPKESVEDEIVLDEEAKNPEVWEEAMKKAESDLGYKPTKEDKKDDQVKYDKFYAKASSIYKQLIKKTKCESNIIKTLRILEGITND